MAGAGGRVLEVRILVLLVEEADERVFMMCMSIDLQHGICIDQGTHASEVKRTTTSSCVYLVSFTKWTSKQLA